MTRSEIEETWEEAGLIYDAMEAEDRAAETVPVEISIDAGTILLVAEILREHPAPHDFGAASRAIRAAITRLQQPHNPTEGTPQ
ncbi:MAG: hypothetical protein Q4615_04360 [Paracoccus aminovorans]|nr:hypothetical protein [Paracoccus aminovorans]